MNKYLVILSLCFSLQSFAQNGDREKNYLVKFVDMQKAVFEVFPEAIQSRFSYSAIKRGDKMIPEDVSFYIPEKIFKSKLLDLTEIDRRAHELVEILELENACPSSLVKKDRLKEHKRVREITIYFGIGLEC